MIFTERDAARLANEAMHDRMDRKRDNERFYDSHSLALLEAHKAIRGTIGVQLPSLTVEAATARISAIRDIADEWQYSHEGLNPAMFEAEFARLLAFIAHNP